MIDTIHTYDAEYQRYPTYTATRYDWRRRAYITRTWQDIGRALPVEPQPVDYTPTEQWGTADVIAAALRKTPNLTARQLAQRTETPEKTVYENLSKNRGKRFEVSGKRSFENAGLKRRRSWHKTWRVIED